MHDPQTAGRDPSIGARDGRPRRSLPDVEAAAVTDASAMALMLQRSVGNAATSAILAHRAREQGAVVTGHLQRMVEQKNASKDPAIPQKFVQAMDNFTTVLGSDSVLGWMVKAKAQDCMMYLTFCDQLGTSEADTLIEIKGSGRVKTDWMALGGGNFGRLRELLQSGTPKSIRITINLSKAVLESKSEALIASAIAHEVGDHVAPYAAILQQAVAPGKEKALSSGSVSVLEQVDEGTSGSQDHLDLHAGYLNIDWSPWRAKPRYRELTEALTKVHYTGDAAAAMWQEYIEDVARYDARTGEPLKDQSVAKRQEQFYTNYEAYRRGEQSMNPRIGVMASKVGVSIPLLMLVLVIGYIFNLLPTLGLGGGDQGPGGLPPEGPL